MKLLDLFSGAGGAAMGYHRAGFEVLGVDIETQKNYPFKFIQADALEYLTDNGHNFDAIHASPPCQAYSWSAAKWRNRGVVFPDMVDQTRKMLIQSGKPYVIENVPDAPVRGFMLCGTMFGLRVLRHRLFECSLFGQTLWDNPGSCSHNGSVRGGQYVTVAGHGGDGCARWAVWCDAMGIDWMTKLELTQSIPPAYTEYIGRQMMRQLEGVER